MNENAIRMSKLLKRENVRILDAVKNWQEAVQVAITPLVKQAYCEARYIDGIISNTEKFGPYYVLCEDLALIHAEANKGVLATQLTVTVLKKPIQFKKDGLHVRVLIGLTAKDSKTHLYAMQAISNICSNVESINKIVNATSIDAIYNQFIQSVD